MRKHLEVTGTCQRKMMALPTSVWQKHMQQGRVKPSVPILVTTGKHLLSCPMCDLWASHHQATSWIVWCLLEINFCWSHTEVGTAAFEYLHPANKIYVPWKAKKAAISCFLTFIVSFSLLHTAALVGTNVHARYGGGSFLLRQLCFKKALVSLLPLSITSVKFI